MIELNRRSGSEDILCEGASIGKPPSQRTSHAHYESQCRSRTEYCHECTDLCCTVQPSFKRGRTRTCCFPIRSFTYQVEDVQDAIIHARPPAKCESLCASYRETAMLPVLDRNMDDTGWTNTSWYELADEIKEAYRKPRDSARHSQGRLYTLGHPVQHTYNRGFEGATTCIL